jgi:hypothetical protein
MGLEEYEARNPQWKRQWDQYHEAKIAANRAHKQAANLDIGLGSLVGELAKNMDAKQSLIEEAAEAAKRSHSTHKEVQLRLYDEVNESPGKM